MNNYQKWFQTVLVLILLPVFLVGGFNYYIDPLWTFNHAHQYNRIQLSFNERQQKTNHSRRCARLTGICSRSRRARA